MYAHSINYVPVDFIKAQVIGLSVSNFINNPMLSEPISIYSGELLTKTIYKYKNLSIKIFVNNNRIEFSGSLHTFYNNGLHNHNDFGKTQFKIAINRLYSELNIKPKNLYLLHLEWGFNIKPPRDSNYIIDSLIQHKSVNKTVSIDCKIEGKYSQFKHSDFILKIYNKSQQFKLNSELLRIEIKQTNWSKYRLKGIRTLNDFINTDGSIFFNELLKQWERVIFFDIDNSKIDGYYKYQTTTFWNELRQNYSNKTFKYHFDKLKELNKEIGHNTQSSIIKALQDKGNELQL